MATAKRPAKKKTAPRKAAKAKSPVPATALPPPAKALPAAARANPGAARPKREFIAVDENSSPEVLFTAGRERLPYWGEKGPGLEERRKEAVELLERAAKAGHLGAIDLLAGGLGGKDAFNWAVVAARMGEPSSLISGLTSGDLPTEQAMSVLEAARREEPWAMYAVGMVYGMGMQYSDTGVYVATQDGAWGWLPGKPDPDAESDRLISKAADAGFSAAALNRATDLHRRRKFEAALARLKQVDAAQLSPGSRGWMTTLTIKLLEAVKAPIEERVALHLRLAEGGNEESMVWLAARFRSGKGVERDLARARALYERAAAAGSVDGLRELGRMCEAGIAGPVDKERARELYEQAAELGADAFSRDRLAKKFGLTWYARQPGEE